MPTASRRSSCLGARGWYVQDFIEKFSNVVSEETYIQDSSVPMQSAALIGRAGSAARNRILKSDFLLVSVSSAQDWIPFRDVFEVDAQPIRDREQRLARLFLKPSENSLEQAYRIQDESARYNLGNMRRTINNPVLAMVVVQAEFQNRFRYSLGKMDPKVGPGVWIVDYHEEARPAIHQGPIGSRPVRARAHLDRSRNRTSHEDRSAPRTTLASRPDHDVVSLRRPVRHRRAVRNAGRVPVRQRHQVTAVATYDRFRRFDVSTDENIKADNNLKD